ncbi:hypothetical protein JCGZ_15446 [Jatropha curcas]|uniref:DCD domain-containing protein n=2 Tax=Jatropha curcas TaxID=180498 RepID=A0A067KI19_JATCU|nr:hypothetical protein JCGZ_15446 [Jatropha curcas]
MEFDTKKKNVQGKVPDFGAIFMSNSATKEECFRRKLFGLPLGQADFVKQVKAGMILFLFEFESRELCGVFQACSDGAINIVPHAFTSSGKQFPAQVKFTIIWHCSSLSESEFCHAIRENYFSPNKFNFGLSAKQVQELLSLFSLRKSKNKNLQGYSIRSEVARPIAFPLHKARNAVDGDRFLVIDDGKDKRNTDDYSSRAFTANQSIHDPITIGVISQPECKWNELNGSRPSVPNEHPGLFQAVPPVYSSKYDSENFFHNDHLQQSIMHSSMESQNLNVPYSTNFGHTVVTSAPSYDPEVPALNYRNSPVPEFSPDSSAFPQLANQSLLSHVEHNFTSRHAITNSDLSNNILSSYPNLCEYSKRTSKLFLGTLYPETVGKASECEIPRRFTVPNPSSIPLCFSASGSNRTNEGASYSNSQSKSSSCVFDCSYPVVSQDKDGHRLLHFENYETFAADIPVLKKGISGSIDMHDNTSGNLDISYSEKIYSCCQKKRPSVFSRLSLPPKVFKQNTDIQIRHVESSIDSSVDEVMAILYESHDNWVKEKSFKLLIKRREDIINTRNKRPMIKISKSSANKLAKISVDEESVVQIAEKLPFVDFKCRSEVRRLQSDASSRVCNKSVESNGSLDGKNKRRRLIRPKFTMNESFGNVMVGGQDKKVSQVLEIAHVSTENNIDSKQKLCIGCEERNADAEKDSNNERENNVENCVMPFRDSYEEKKEEPHIIGIDNVPLSGFCKGQNCDLEESSTFKSSEDYGLLQNHNDTSCSVLPESFIQLHEVESVNGVTSGGLKHDGDSTKSTQNVEYEKKSCSITDDSLISSSMKNNSEFEKSTDELGNGNNASKQQLSVESVSGQCKASAEILTFGNLQKSAEGICEEQDQNSVSVATASKSSKVNFKDDITNGCETIAENCLSNQSLFSCEELVHSGVSSEG